MRKNKKGNAIFDTLLIVVFLVVFSIVSIFGYKLFGDLNTDIQADTTMDATAKNETANLYARYPATFDGAFILIFILFWAFVIVSTFMIDTHPIFFIFTVIISVFVIFVGAIMANTWAEINAEEDLTGLAASFPMTNYVLSHFVIYILLIVFSVVITLFGKSRMG